jgi:hypothetical protein
MTKYLFLSLTVLFAACGNGDDSTAPANTTTEVDLSGFTKEFEYAIDAPGMFHPDLTDEDFSDVSAIMVSLLNDALAGKLQALDPITEEPMDVAQLRAKLFYTDTVYYEDPNTNQTVAEAITRDLGREFHSVKFREQWRYSPDGAVIERRVLALAPRIPVYSSTGDDIRGYTSLFWIKVEDGK